MTVDSYTFNPLHLNTNAGLGYGVTKRVYSITIMSMSGPMSMFSLTLLMQVLVFRQHQFWRGGQLTASLPVSALS